MDVFEAFPNAIISNQWEIGEVRYGTETGTQFSNPVACDVIIDEATSASVADIPDLKNESLLYARASDMPTLLTSKLATNYMWHDKTNDLYFMILQVGLGKNQETGKVEHVEFVLRQTEVANG